MCALWNAKPHGDIFRFCPSGERKTEHSGLKVSAHLTFCMGPAVEARHVTHGSELLAPPCVPKALRSACNFSSCVILNSPKTLKTMFGFSMLSGGWFVQKHYQYFVNDSYSSSIKVQISSENCPFPPSTHSPVLS